MRHHPPLKQSIMSAIMTTLQRIIEIGSSYKDDAGKLYVDADDDQPVSMETLGEESTDTTMADPVAPKSEDKKENTVVAFIEVAARVCVLRSFG